LITRDIAVDLPASEPQHDVLATLWARTRIAELMSQDYGGLQRGQVSGDLKNEITQLGLVYRLMTQFTSFVAVEETTVTEGGQPRRVEVPVEMPEGVSYEGVFGQSQDRAYKSMGFAPAMAAPSAYAARAAGGVVGGVLAAPQEVGVHAEVSIETPNRVIRYKLEAKLALVIQVWKDGKPFTAEQQKFCRDGKAYVEVWLDDVTPQIRERLRQLGFEPTEPSKVAKVVIGRIAISKLEALAKLEGVRYVAPHAPRI
jgi:Ca-activated chloride channel family protein